jgi:tetratricopeptide (TPR) repeat protein
VGRILVPAAAGLVVVLPLAANYHKNDKSQYYWAYDYGRNVLTSLERDAIYIPAADHATFPAIYLQAVEGLRPDVAIGNKYGYPEESLYADMPDDMRSKFRKIPTSAEEEIIEDWIIRHTDRPVYFSRKRSFPNLPSRKLAGAGLVYKVVDEAAPVPARDYWSEYTWHTLDSADTRGDLTAEFALSDYHFAKGRDALDAGRTDEALQSFDTAVAIGGYTKESLNNVGSACAEQGLLGEAAKFYARTLELDPDYDFAVRNLGKIYLEQGRHEQALALFNRILKKTPIDPEANWLSAQCLKNKGDLPEALRRLDLLSHVTPNDAKVFKEMGLIYFNEMRDQEKAREMFAKSLEIQPNQMDLSALMADTRQGVPKPEFDQPPMPNVPGLENLLPQLPSVNLPDAAHAPQTSPTSAIPKPQAPVPHIPLRR